MSILLSPVYSLSLFMYNFQSPVLSIPSFALQSLTHFLSSTQLLRPPLTLSFIYILQILICSVHIFSLSLQSPLLFLFLHLCDWCPTQSLYLHLYYGETSQTCVRLYLYVYVYVGDSVDLFD